VGPAALSIFGTIHNVCFCTALASIGLNASLQGVVRRLPKPVLLTLGVFVLDAGIFLSTRSFFVR
jgi:uncharacterized membrane protein YadS